MAKSKRNTHRTVVRPEQPEPTQVIEQESGVFFESPESSTIASAYFSKDNGHMTVFFRRGPSRDNERYDYSGIPVDLWERFAAAESKGHFFSTQIRPLYAGKPEKS